MEAGTRHGIGIHGVTADITEVTTVDIMVVTMEAGTAVIMAEAVITGITIMIIITETATDAQEIPVQATDWQTEAQPEEEVVRVYQAHPHVQAAAEALL
jgi:hypothetical protein